MVDSCKKLSFCKGKTLARTFYSIKVFRPLTCRFLGLVDSCTKLSFCKEKTVVRISI